MNNKFFLIFLSILSRKLIYASNFSVTKCNLDKSGEDTNLKLQLKNYCWDMNTKHVWYSKQRQFLFTCACHISSCKTNVLINYLSVNPLHTHLSNHCLLCSRQIKKFNKNVWYSNGSILFGRGMV